jgi:hypothetical protein
LTYCKLLGASKSYRILPSVQLWIVLATINLVYTVTATSWLVFYGIFAVVCYPTVFFTCLFQFNFGPNFTRAGLRRFPKQLHFVDDKIALFNIPTLEINVDVDRPIIVRAMMISPSTLTILIHGIELGTKSSGDLEIAIQTEELTVALFRSIEIGDVMAISKVVSMI